MAKVDPSAFRLQKHISLFKKKVLLFGRNFFLVLFVRLEGSVTEVSFITS